jgi:hypothetical protein
MPTLHPAQRTHLEKTVIAARDKAEEAAHNALKRLAVDQDEPFAAQSETERALRRRLRAEMRRLGSLDALVGECAYEHWHRMLFARFLAENDLLIHPDTQVAVTLHDCAELAEYEGDADAWACAARYASHMLPAIFRQTDPILEVRFDALGRQNLERLLNELPTPVFTAEDSIGWVYQFWQTKRKKEVNEGGEKVGGADISPVTQLFTEHYMVEFLLHNSLGAWWAARHPGDSLNAKLTYLRTTEDGVPAAGSFSGWPTEACKLKILDPCCGSGHFLVAAFDLMRQMRMREEDLSETEAADAVLRDNLFGLELDPRCTQIAAFAVAMSAWKAGGYRTLPQLAIACSGLAVGDRLHEWTSLAAGNHEMEATLRRLYRLFQNAPNLGSLIDPAKVAEEDGMFAQDWSEVGPLLTQALANEQRKDEEAEVFGIAAQGVAQAAQLLAQKYHLVITNVPYLARGKQGKTLFNYLEERHNDAKADLATAFVDRCLAFCCPGGSVQLVTPQGWLFLTRYQPMRQRLIQRYKWDMVARLGTHAFETISGEVVNISLLILTNSRPNIDDTYVGLDASLPRSASEKALSLSNTILNPVLQSAQLNNPDGRIAIDMVQSSALKLLSAYASAPVGIMTGDTPRHIFNFWELSKVTKRWQLCQTSGTTTKTYDGYHLVAEWTDENGGSPYDTYSVIVGKEAWGKRGVAVFLTGELRGWFYEGAVFDKSIAVLVPHKPQYLPAIWAFCSSTDFNTAVRRIDQSLKVTNKSLIKIPFEIDHWQEVANKQQPNGLPQPHSDDPTQWLFNGHPVSSDAPLHVAVARLLGYRWPQNEDDDLVGHADEDGIVCLPTVVGEAPAAERLRVLLAHAYGAEWSPAVQEGLLAQAGGVGLDLEGWLRDKFFDSHCKLFGQRPFIWHIWDGRKDGFGALVNYHGLDRAKLDKLIYTYLGGWIKTQKEDVRQGVAGSDGRLVAAENLQKKLIAIAEGEPPLDIYVRWKPLAKQAIGWEPDINDGVRMNIRPFMTADVLRGKPNIKWGKDRGKNPDGTDRLNDLHLMRAEKEAARRQET